MTRDVKRDLAPETFNLTVKGLTGQARFSAYDPLRDTQQKVRAQAFGTDGVKLELSATDYPLLLEVDESASSR